MKSIQVAAYGDPADVVRIVDVPDVEPPGPDEIVIHVEAAPIEPSDLYMIAGVYGNLPPLPHILGIQGVGRVSAVGNKVKHLREGDRTLVPPFAPSLVERVKTSAAWLRPLPNADLNQLSMIGINPATAYLMMTEFVQLKPGDWLLQNAANSSVGRAVIAIAKWRGLRTVNVVRRAELIDQMAALGGDVVLVDGPDLPDRVAAATGNGEILLGLDGVGDSAPDNLLQSLALYGTLVIWSGMSGKPFTTSGIRLLFRDQSIRGFWIFNWFRAPDPGKVAAVYEALLPLIASGALSFPVVGEFTFEQYKEALGVAAKLSGKVILRPGTGP
jgi:NADPH:quinone reductase-like Zn-dependent oxidoreductase